MFKVSTCNLAPDARAAAADLGTHEVGELDAEKFTALLETFRELDPLQNAETDPQIVVHAPGGKFIVRTGRGKLLLYNARNTTESAVELTAAEIVAQLERLVTMAGPVGETTADEAITGTSRPQLRGLAFALLAVGFALIGYAVYSALQTDVGDKPPALTPISDSIELAACQRSVVGTYATGQEPGDHGLVVEAEGVLKFLEFLSPGEQNEIRDTYRIGRQGSKVCLATDRYGALIEVIDSDTLVYATGTYQRTK